MSLTWKDYANNHFSEPDARAWVSDKGEVHQLPSSTVGDEFTHMGWMRAHHGAESEAHPRGTLGVETDLVKKGWLRKVASDYYEAHGDHLDKVAKHLRDRHPEIDRALVRVRRGNQTWADSDEWKTVHKSGRVSPPEDFKPKREMWMATHGSSSRDEEWKREPDLMKWVCGARNHAWIAPDDTVHTLERQHHSDFAFAHPKYKAQATSGGHGLADAFSTMLKDGWIRKFDHDQYDVHDASQIPRVFAHIKRHAPADLESLTVIEDGRGARLHDFRKVGGKWQDQHGTVVEHTLPPDVRLAPEDTRRKLAQALKAGLEARKRRKAAEQQPAQKKTEDADDLICRVLEVTTWMGDKENLRTGPYALSGDTRRRPALRTTSKDQPGRKFVGVRGEFVLDDPSHEVDPGPNLKRFRKPKNESAEKPERVLDPVRDFKHQEQRAWIDPSGQTLPLPGFKMHWNWVRSNMERVPAEHRGHVGKCSDRQFCPDADTGCQHTLDSLLTRLTMTGSGWIRKISNSIYDAHPSHWGRVLDHVRKNHPEVKTIDITHAPEHQYDAAKTLRGNDSALSALVADSKHTNKTTLDVKSGKVVGQKLLKEDHDEIDDYHRAWIEPNGRVHDVGLDMPLETHAQWVQTNGHKIPQKLKGRTSNETHQNLLTAGWVKKHASDMYTGTRAARKTIHKHFTKFHPHLSHVNLEVYGEDPGGRDPYGVPLTMPIVTDKGEIKEMYTQPSRSEPADFMEPHDRAWISPKGEVHQLSTTERDFYQWPTETHFGWIERNHKLLKGHGIDVENDHAFDSAEKMLDSGWVRKVHSGRYEVGSPQGLDVVKQHVKQHHSDRKEVEIYQRSKIGSPHETLKIHEDTYGTDDGDSEDARDEYANFQTSHRGWIDKNNTYYKIGALQVHSGWMDRNRPHEFEDTICDPIRQGWIRKAAKNQYHGEGFSRLPDVMRHVKKEHPEVKVIQFLADHRGDTAYHLPVAEPSHYEGASHASLRDFATSSDRYDERKMMPESFYNRDAAWKDGTQHESRVDRLIKLCLGEAWRGGPLSNWLAKRSAGWIDPKGGYYKLEDGEHHREWVTHPRNCRALRDVHNAMDPFLHSNSPAVQEVMLKQGWVRKLDHDQYIVGKHADVDKAIQHFNTHHPNRRGMEVGVENYPKKGQLKRFYFQRHPETQQMMPRKKWRAERRQVGTSERNRKWRSSK